MEEPWRSHGRLRWAAVRGVEVPLPVPVLGAHPDCHHQRAAVLPLDCCDQRGMKGTEELAGAVDASVAGDHCHDLTYFAIILFGPITCFTEGVDGSLDPATAISSQANHLRMCLQRPQNDGVQEQTRWHTRQHLVGPLHLRHEPLLLLLLVGPNGAGFANGSQSFFRRHLINRLLALCPDLCPLLLWEQCNSGQMDRPVMQTGEGLRSSGR